MCRVVDARCVHVKPETRFDEGIKKTLAWYLDHKGWCDRITETKYRRERLGAEAKS
jgi:dTDP-glucose 4,6-dehydratase